MPESDPKLSPGALLVAALLSSGVGGVGTNFFMGDYKLHSLTDEVSRLQSDAKELRDSFRSLTAAQNECLTETKLLEYRLNSQEKHK